MSRVMRIGSMVDGYFCPVMIDGHIKNHMVRTDKEGKLYISYKGKKFTEEKMPMGDEVEV